MYLLLEIVHLVLLWSSSSETGAPNILCHPCRCCIENGDIHADCTRLNLSSVPAKLPRNIASLNLAFNRLQNMEHVNVYKNLTSLNISFNKLAVLPKKSALNLRHLKTLVLHDNKLKKLTNDSFSRLPSLETLDLRSNQLNLSTDVYPRGLFRSQKRLRKLMLQGNCQVGYLGPTYPDATLGDLTSLQELRIDGILNASFGSGFGHMDRLSNLSFGNCNIRHMTNKTFTYLPHLQFLNISQCNLLTIELGVFVPLQTLIVLDISDNSFLGVAVVSRAMHGLENSSLKILRANRLQHPRETGILIRVEDMKSMAHMQLEEVHLDDNRIELLETKVPLHLPRTLKVVSLQHNLFYYGNYLFTLSVMPTMKYLYMSHQHQSGVLPYTASIGAKRMTRSSEENNVFDKSAAFNWKRIRNVNNLGNPILPFPPNLTYWDASASKLKFSLPKLSLSRNSLQHLDFSHNIFSHWEGPITGLDKLEYFDLSDNFCDNVSEKFFSEFTSLRVLNLSSNFLAYTLTARTFRNLQTLEVLDLANNKIQYLPKKIFENLSTLKILNISFNFMSNLGVDVNPLSHLTALDLSYNLLTEVPNEIRLFMSEHSSLVSLILAGNPQKCTCATLPSLKWNIKNKNRLFDFDNLYCITENHSNQYFRNLDQVVRQLEKECTSYAGVMTGVLSVLMLCLGLIVSALTYRYRWKLRYLFYLARIRHRGFVPVHEDDEFDFDAFISYADEDRALVVSEMRTILEEGRGLRLCIHHRDFLPGTYIVDNILSAVRRSRKTVVMLSKNFLKSKWCKYEAEMARVENIYTQRNTLLVVVLEDIPLKDLPSDLLEIMRSESYVEYTEDEEGRHVFWENLYRGITAT